MDHVPAISLVDPYFQWFDGLLGPSSCSDEGVSLSQNLGFSPSTFQRGFVADDGRV